MGTLFYGGMGTPLHIEDRALAHLKVVISTKLRRNESFTVTIQHPAGQEPARSTLWIQPAIPLRFVFDSPDPEALSRQWIEDLAASASSAAGITIAEGALQTPEPRAR